MKRQKNIKWDKRLKKALLLSLLSFIVVLVFVRHPVPATSWSLLPPVIAIFMAFVSGRVGPSLGLAVLMGGFISAYGENRDVLAGLSNMLWSFQSSVYKAGTDKTNLQILGFVFFILTTVHVMTRSGGLKALVDSLKGWIVGPRSAQFVTALLGCFIFIDDYANTMIVGSTMKEVTDRHGISREKLAFLVDATSAPIAGVALVSTWIGYEVGLFNEMARQFSWSIDGYGIFINAVGFRFYCLTLLVFVFVNIFFGIDFGSMKESQDETRRNPPPKPLLKTHKGSLLCATIPLFTLIILVFTFLWFDGGGSSLSPFSFNNWKQVLTNSKNGIPILLISSVVSLLTATATAFFKSSFGFKDLIETFYSGVKSALLPIMILVLAWSLKSICDDLKTAEFIVARLGKNLSPQSLVLFVFIVSGVTAFAIGTSWGTMAILIPIVTPLAVSLGGGDYGVLVSLCLAAILDGSIMGDHCSPISDTTVMSSISTNCDLISHVKTQLPYSLTVGFLALFAGYLPASYGFSSLTCLGLSSILIVVLFFCLKNMKSRF